MKNALDDDFFYVSILRILQEMVGNKVQFKLKSQMTD